MSENIIFDRRSGIDGGTYDVGADDDRVEPCGEVHPNDDEVACMNPIGHAGYCRGYESNTGAVWWASAGMRVPD